MGEGLAEWVITTPGGQQLTVQLAYFDRSHEAVDMEIGPVLDLEDVAGGKVCALASRVEPRDYADTARMLERFSPAALIGFARRLDPGLTARDFADAGRQLDRDRRRCLHPLRTDPPRCSRAAGQVRYLAAHPTPPPSPMRRNPRTRQPREPTTDGKQSPAASTRHGLSAGKPQTKARLPARATDLIARNQATTQIAE